VQETGEKNTGPTSSPSEKQLELKYESPGPLEKTTAQQQNGGFPLFNKPDIIRCRSSTL